MPIQVKGYKRKTKKGVTIVNPFSRKGNKKLKDNNVVKKAVLGTLGLGVLAGASVLLKNKGIKKPIVSVKDALNNASYKKLPDPWVSQVDNSVVKKVVSAPKNNTASPQKLLSPGKAEKLPDPWITPSVTKKVVTTPQAGKLTVDAPQKLLAPSKVEVTTPKLLKVEATGLQLEGKQLTGVHRGHGRLRIVHKGKTGWDKQLVKDKDVLDLAKSKGQGSIADNQRALEIFKKKQSEKGLVTRTAKKSKQVGLNIEKVVSVGSKKKVTVNTTQRLDRFVKKFNDSKKVTETKKIISGKDVLSKVKEVRSIAEGATVKKVKGSRRDLLTAFIPKTIKDITVPDVTPAIVKAKKIVNNNAETISKTSETVKKQVGAAKETADKVKKAVSANLDKELKKIVPKNETAQNLTKAAKKEAKKQSEVQALNKVNPLLGKIHYVKEDIKSRAEQLTRYSDELEGAGEKVLGRRQLFRKTGQKVVKEVTKKPKDGLNVARGTIGKTRVLVRNNAGKVERAAGSMQEMGGRFYGRQGDIGVYRSTLKPAVRPSKGLLRRLSKSNERFMRWKSGNLD